MANDQSISTESIFVRYVRECVSASHLYVHVYGFSGMTPHRSRAYSRLWY